MPNKQHFLTPSTLKDKKEASLRAEDDEALPSNRYVRSSESRLVRASAVNCRDVSRSFSLTL